MGSTPEPKKLGKKKFFKHNRWYYEVPCSYCGAMKLNGNGIAIHEKSCDKNPNRKHHLSSSGRDHSDVAISPSKVESEGESEGDDDVVIVKQPCKICGYCGDFGDFRNERTRFSHLETCEFKILELKKQIPCRYCGEMFAAGYGLSSHESRWCFKNPIIRKKEKKSWKTKTTSVEEEALR